MNLQKVVSKNTLVLPSWRSLMKIQDPEPEPSVKGMDPRIRVRSGSTPKCNASATVPWSSGSGFEPGLAVHQVEALQHRALIWVTPQSIGRTLTWAMPHPVWATPHPNMSYAAKIDATFCCSNCLSINFMHRLNKEVDLQSLFGLLCTAVLIVWDPPETPPLPPHLGSHTRALLVSQEIDDISL